MFQVRDFLLGSFGKVSRGQGISVRSLGKHFET